MSIFGLDIQPILNRLDPPRPPNGAEDRRPLFSRLGEPFHHDTSVVDTNQDVRRLADGATIQGLANGTCYGVGLRHGADWEAIVEALDPFEPSDDALGLFPLDGRGHDAVENDHTARHSRTNALVRDQASHSSAWRTAFAMSVSVRWEAWALLT